MRIFTKSLMTLTLLASFSSHASYLENCELKLRLKNVSRLLELNGTVGHDGSPESAKKLTFVTIAEILAAKDLGSHDDAACRKKIGRLLALKITAENFQTLEEGKVLKVNYRYVSGRSRNGGIADHTTIEIKN